MHAVPAPSDSRVGHPGRRHSSAGDSATRPRILLIESGTTPTMWLTRRLTEEGFSVAAEPWSRRFIVSCVEHCDVMVLDFDSADEDAPSTVRAVRAVRPNLPTIVLDRGDPVHAARVLNSGADDYMTKPYGFDELRARIEVLLRTAALHPSDAAARDVLVDVSRHSRRDRTRLQPPTRARGGGDATADRVDAAVRSLRRKLGSDVIVTVPGVGYRLD